MKYDIIAGPTFPMLRVYLDKGENIKAESGAMVTMTRDLSLTGKADGGILKGLARKLSGESFFMQQLSAEKGPGWALLAAPAPGDIAIIDVAEGRGWTVQKSGFLAGTAGIDVSTKVQSLAKGIFSGEGLFVVAIGGAGTLFLSTYGSIHTIDLPAGEELLVDNGHLVAWENSLRYEITKGATTWVSAATSGEGVACRFFGPGRILIQSRNPRDLGNWLYPYMPQPPKSS